MKRSPHTLCPLLALALALAPAGPAQTGTPGNPAAQRAPEVVRVGENTFSLRWHGVAGRTYFAQSSTDLLEWRHMPVIKSGQGAPLTHNFSGDGSRMFVRLSHTDQPSTSPHSDDFDGDGISNWNEIRDGGTGTDPLLWDTDGDGKSDYFADTDGNGVADGWEITHFGGVGTVDPAADPDGDGQTNAQESWLGTSPFAHAGTNDQDKDGLVDAVDAVPDDALINWPKTPVPRYVLVDIGQPPGKGNALPLAISEAGHVLARVKPENFNWVGYDYYVWQPDTGKWAGPVSKSCNGSWSGDVWATDVGADGRVIGMANVEHDVQGVASGKLGKVCYRATVEWASATAQPEIRGGERFSKLSYMLHVQTTHPPAFSPDGAVLSMDRGGYYDYEPASPQLVYHSPPPVKLGGHRLDQWVVESRWEEGGGSKYGVYHLITNDFGRPGKGNIVPMTRNERHSHAGGRNETTTGVYLFRDGVRETVDDTEKEWGRAAARMPDADGIPGAGRLLVTGTHTWIKQGGAWHRTKRRIGGWAVTPRGIILTSENGWPSNKLWINGKDYTVEELCPQLAGVGHRNYYVSDTNDSGVMVCRVLGEGKKIGLLVPVTFREAEPNAGFDNYERFHEENKLKRPWLTVPGTNRVIMERGLAGVKLDLAVAVPGGKSGAVTPAESSKSSETLTVTGTGPWGEEEYGYEGTLRLKSADVLDLAVYKKRELTVAVHAITLVNDDEELGIKHGEGKPNAVCVRKKGTIFDTVTPGGDDVADFHCVHTGANGICETKAVNDDEQVIPVGNGEPNVVIIGPGPNAVLDTAVFPTDDDTKVGETITTGPDGIRDTWEISRKTLPKNVPSKALLESELNRIFGKQANIFFNVVSHNAVEVAYDISVPGGDFSVDDHPNWAFDLYMGKDLSPEEELVRNAAINRDADINLYFFPTTVRWLQSFDPPVGPKGQVVLGIAVDADEPGTKVAYISACDRQMPAKHLAGVAAHEIAHHKLFAGSVGLNHPWERDRVTGEYRRTGKENYPLMRLEDDKKRLMFPHVQSKDGEFPSLLLKEECDKLRGAWKGVGNG